jgi:hypothetical protein
MENGSPRRRIAGKDGSIRIVYKNRNICGNKYRDGNVPF